jgi:L-malate glycosyltransferase
LKILLISNDFPTELRKLAGIFAFNDLTFLKNKGYDVSMLVLFRYTIERKRLHRISEQIRNNANHIRLLRDVRKNDPSIDLLPYFSFLKPFVFKEDFFLVKDSHFRNQHFNFVIVHSMLHTGLNINWIRKQFPGSKFILKEHSDWARYPKLVQNIALEAGRKYDIILANSNATKRSIEKLYQVNSSIKPQPYTVTDYPKFHINSSLISKKRSGRIKLLTVANLIKEKGYEEAFTIMQILEEASVSWEWTIIGKGVFLNTILSLTKQNSFGDRIRILPEIKKPQLFDYMKESDIYIHLSYGESFGIAPLEAFSFCNKLIISDHITSIKELIPDDNKNILVIKDLQNLNAQKQDIIRFVQEGPNEKDFDTQIMEINRKINSTSMWLSVDGL